MQSLIAHGIKLQHRNSETISCKGCW